MPGSAHQPPRDEESARVEIDTTKPSVARAYDAMLGGKDNYAIDRQLVDNVLRQLPSMYTVTQDNRAWLVRVVHYLATYRGIDQFLDCGSGLPTGENTHEVAQRANPEATVVYVDNDPIVLAHGRALLEENDRTHFAAADLRDPDAVLADPKVAQYLDVTRPIALLQVGSLHHSVDADEPYAFMRRYIDLLAPGSFLALSHFHRPEDGELARTAAELEEFLLPNLETGRFRTHEEITRFFDDLELLEPGVVVLADWWPDGPREAPLEPGQYLMVGGIGRKP